MGKTAAEVMAELEKNKEYQAKKKARDEHFSKLEKMLSDDEKQLVEELNQAGFSVTSVWDFVNSENNYMSAEPILLKHLTIKHHPRTLAGLARSLAVPEFSGNNELWEVLTDLYKKTPSDTEINIPENRGTQEALAVALDCLATKSRVDSLKELVTVVPHGDGVHWLQDRLKEYSDS